MPICRNMTLQRTCWPGTWLNLFSHTRVYLANKMGSSSDSATHACCVLCVSPLCLYDSEQRHVLYGQLYYPDIIIPSLPYRELIWSTNGVSLEARMPTINLMFPLVGVNLNQWLVCAVLLRSVAFFHSGSAEAKCPVSFSFCLNLHSRSYPEFGVLCCLLRRKKRKEKEVVTVTLALCQVVVVKREILFPHLNWELCYILCKWLSICMLLWVFSLWPVSVNIVHCSNRPVP